MQAKNRTRSAAASPLATSRRIVVKVGSALLVDQDTGRLNRAWLESLIEDLRRLRRRGQQVILVSSGAVALGRRHLKLPKGTLRLEEKQAAAAVGQIRLAHAYKELLEDEEITVAQVLLTLQDSEQRDRYLNARATLTTLLELGAIPVINENDTSLPAKSAMATTIGWPRAWRRWPAPTALCCSRMSMACTPPTRTAIPRLSSSRRSRSSPRRSRPWPVGPPPTWGRAA